MRVAFYNQMFALNGRSLRKSLAGHWRVHRRKDPQKMYEVARLKNTCDIIDSSNPDIVGLCEVLEGQEKILADLLARRGYNCFFGQGHQTKGNRLHLGVMLASKFELERVDSQTFPVKNKMGGGGGFVHCKATDMDLDVLGVHLSNGKNPKKRGDLCSADGIFKRLC
ncbi:hypothetical protein A3K73_08985 [Candidatus Pacearchaeota archaeon RBG_13_36_9]|nr:MAG: hypothetical protein A3K73_08985 [Candidatus Pacearchaeota archaeon RBG_13_36_9]